MKIYKASFKIVINPDKLKLNGGNQIDVKDVITVTEGAGAKVRLIPDSLKITLDPAGDYSTDYSEDRTTLNIKIPDECKECKILPICMGGCPVLRRKEKKACPAVKYNYQKLLQLVNEWSKKEYEK